MQKSYDDMKNQLSVKDNQISTLTQLADQAQKLNLVDKPRLVNNNEDNPASGEEKKVQETNAKKHWLKLF